VEQVSYLKNAVAQTTNESANYGGAPEEQVVVRIKKLETTSIQEEKKVFISAD